MDETTKLLNWAWESTCDKEYEAALSYARQAVALSPDYDECYLQMGYALEAMGQTDRAELVFHKAAELAPRRARPFDSLARLYRNAGDKTSELQSLKKAALADDSHEAEVARGMLHYYEKRYRQAIPHFERAEVKVPEGVNSHFIISWLHLMKGVCLLYDRRVDEAYRWLQEAATGSDPTDFALYHLALAEFQRRKWHKAFVYAQRVLTVNPDHYCAHCLLANLQIRRGHLRQAWRSFRKAVKVLEAQKPAAT